MDLKEKIRDIPDFPKKGILFRDITTLLKDRDAFKTAIDLFSRKYDDQKIEQIVAIESRGFIFGSALAHQLGTGFVPVRKPGKLPSATERFEYQLEYGSDCLEIHRDALQPNQRILIVDDLLATGGTAAATAHLVEKLAAKVVGLAFLIELTFLGGREKLKGYDVHSLIQY
ncbi:MAG: adenine phosphoribosyltransferase [Acidobacteria bacterium]|nr:MAG: adenine phosphoribosyltransferase [Acidobacteriota bacterium]